MERKERELMKLIYISISIYIRKTYYKEEGEIKILGITLFYLSN